VLQRLVINSIALVLVFYLVWGYRGDALLVAAAMAVALALINAFVRPVLLILTLPITVATLGCFLVFLNALLFWLAIVLLEHLFRLPYHIGFWKAALGWLVFTVVSFALSHLVE
jgi:putative membrane protein